MGNCAVDYDALSAWSTLIGAAATAVAIAIALWQSARARNDLNKQIAHQNWLEQKKIEERYLTQMFDLLERPYALSQDFYFSMVRLLGSVKYGLPKGDGLEDEVRRSLDRFGEVTSNAERTIGNFVDIANALRELHESRGEVAAAEQLYNLLQDVERVLAAASSLREWLANPETIVSISPNGFFDEPLVAETRNRSNAAARSIARRLVRLYERDIPIREASHLVAVHHARVDYPDD